MCGASAGGRRERAVANDTPVREAGLFGRFGLHVNVTDGRHVYLHAPPKGDQPCYQYTRMPTDMTHTFPASALQDIELAAPFSFTKGWRAMRINSGSVTGVKSADHGNTGV